MNYYQEKAIILKTGEPLKKKEKVPHLYGLWSVRLASWIITGSYALCKWKQNEEKRLNPLHKTLIKVKTD